MSFPTTPGAYHIGIRRDKAKDAHPLSTLIAGGVTFHAYSMVYDSTNEANLHRDGKVENLTAEQLVKIRDGLTVDRRPVLCEKAVQVARDDEPRLRGLLVRERRLPDGRVSREYRDMPYGKGLVFQWRKTENGWCGELINLASSSYRPVAEASKNAEGDTIHVLRDEDGKVIAEEVNASKLIYMLPAPNPRVTPPAVDMRDVDRDADKIEGEEEARDPGNFERVKERNRKAKAAGVSPESLPSS